MWQQYNPNPQKNRNGDCAVRAMAAALGTSWDHAYTLLTVEGYRSKDLPNADHCWGKVLEDHGFVRRIIDTPCAKCYSVRDFAAEHPQGTFVLGCHNHVLTVISGAYWDTWDSGDESPIYYWAKED